MKTTIEQRENQLIITTTARRSFDSDWHAMVRSYHIVSAAQALEAAIRDGYRLLHPKELSKPYWEDGVLAHMDEMAIYTVFIIVK